MWLRRALTGSIFVFALSAVAQTVTLTDPSGDVGSNPSYPGLPDLISATVSAGAGLVTFDIGFASGTRADANLKVMHIVFDTDQNTQTGWAGWNGIGGDFAFFLQGNEHWIGSFTPSIYGGAFSLTLPIAVTLSDPDRLQFSIPFSAMGDDDGKFNFRIAVGIDDQPGEFFYTDSIPDWAAPVGTTGQGTPPPRITQFSATPQSIAAGQEITLSWLTSGAVTSVTLDGSPIPANGSTVEKPSQKKTYSLKATGPGGSAVASVTVDVLTSAALVITRFPGGLIQVANSGGGSQPFVITNVGGGSTQVAVEPQGGFFTVSPQSFSLAAGASQEVVVTATAQPAGAHEGSARISATGVSAQTTVPVRLLSSEPPAGAVIPAATVPRVDVSSSGSTPVDGTVTFTNQGSAPLQGIATANVDWITVESGVITINPGQSHAVSFTIDPSKRKSEGAESAKLSLDFLGSGSNLVAGRAETAGAGGSQNFSVSLVHTKAPTVSATSIPSTNEPLWFLPGVMHTPTTVTDLLAFHRPVNGLPATLSAYYLAARTPSSNAKQALFNNVAPSSTVALADVVSSVFGDPSPLGSVLFRAPTVRDVNVFASVFNKSRPQGLFGSGLVSFRSDRAVGQNGQIYLVGVGKDASTKTTLVLQETSGVATTVTTSFLNSTGVAVTSRTDALGRFEVLELGDVVPEGAVVAVLTNTGLGRLLARGLLTDLASGDVSDITDWNVRGGTNPLDPQMVMLGGRGEGSATELVITNRGDETLTGTLAAMGTAPRRRVVRRGSNASPPPQGTVASAELLRLVPEENAVEVTLGPRQSTVFDDVVSKLGAREGSVLVFTPRSGSAALGARVRTPSNVFGSFSTTLPVVGIASGLKRGESKGFGGVDAASTATISRRRAASFRAALALLETAGQAVTVRATLQFTEPASALVTVRGTARKDYSLGPGQFLQIDDMARDIIGPQRDRFDDLRNMQLDISVIEGDGVVLPVVVLTENGTGDQVLRLD